MTAISAFDLDYTLLQVNSSFRFGLHLCRRGLIPRNRLFFILSCTLRHSLGLMPIESIHRRAFERLFLGLPRSSVERWATEFIDQYLDDFLYPPVHNELKRCQQAGDLIAILSSSPDFLVAPIAERLQIPLWYATEYGVDKDGCFCHISQMVLGDDKKSKIAQLQRQMGCAKEMITAYSDSHLDLPFLSSAGTAVAVNPTRQLRAICKNRKWNIIE